jgi:hypothetical protein
MVRDGSWFVPTPPSKPFGAPRNIRVLPVSEKRLIKKLWAF